MSDPLTVLVTGATGKQGGAVADALIARGHAVRAMTRSPDGAAARDLARRGAAIVPGDFDDPKAIAAALAGTDTAFLMATPYEAGGTDAERRQGIAFTEAAEAAGLGHLIYSSVASADRATGVPHFESKFAIEERLRASPLGWSIVAPVAFMDFLAPQFRDGLAAGELRFPIPAERKVQWVAPADIGAAVAELAERRAGAYGLRIELIGDELAGTELAATLGAAAGRTLRYVAPPVAPVRSFSEDIALMLEWIDAVGYDADRPALARTFPGLRWQSVADWAAAQDWSGVATSRKAG